MYRILLLLISAVVCLIGLGFHLQNDHLVDLNYFLGTVEYHFSFFIISSLLLGILLGILAMLPIYLTLKRENRKISRQIKLKDKEVNNLRAIPIKDDH